MDIRKKYLDFFKSKGHAVISPASLIPENDPSLLFVNSGMFPLVPYLLGETHPEGTRLCDSQPSFRTNDIEEVGDQRHTTLFEMLGNWSLGDYFKKEQLNWCFEFLIDELGLDIKDLYVTVYGGSADAPKDEEAISILTEIYEQRGITAEEGPATTGKGEDGPGVEVAFGGNQRIFTYVDKNWWQRGDAVGEPGGPDAEVFYDTGKDHDSAYGQYCHVNCDCGRFIEIGNSVFMQYKKAERGWEELEKKNIDFGGGLERMAMAVAGKSNMFETDIFAPIISAIAETSGTQYRDNMKAFEVITDHTRAAVFLIGDGVIPSNLAQGYFVRRLIRRAIRFGHILGISDNFLGDLAIVAISTVGDHYTHLKQKQKEIVAAIVEEEEKFRKTLEKGLKVFEALAQGADISGKEAYILFTTYGFPIEMTQELAIERGLRIDMDEFNKEMDAHKELSRTASSGMFKGGLADASEETTKLHTATHLLNQALRDVLGDHVEQRGSNINKDRLRFDFTHADKMTDEQIKEVERIVNEQIKAGLEVSVTEMSVDDAKAQGAIGVFDTKYDEKVKVYRMGEFSKEICGGPHVTNTAELEGFKITKEQSSSAGIRRIKAIVGPNLGQ